MKWTEELKGLLEANVALINLVTYEEERVIEAVKGMDAGLGIYTWDVADGLKVERDGAQAFPAKKELNSQQILPHLREKAPKGCVVVLKDFHNVWARGATNRAVVVREMRNMVPKLRKQSQYLILLTPVVEVPVELKDDVFVMEVPLPGREDLERVFDGMVKEKARPEVRERLIRSALGLTANQAQLAFSRVWAQFRRFDDRGIDVVTEAKRRVIRESGALTFSPAEEGEADVGGLDLLKAWLTKRERAFGEEARREELPYPRGVALIGIPGTGKSLSAKMTSGVWKLPLLRLDVGALLGSLLGEADQNLRRALQLAETVSPCILWVDEMEKAFGGGARGHEAVVRVFGSFLTWMQEHTAPVFVMATANDVSALPPELLSRFDRTFFLDLPNAAERRQIFLIHLKRAKVDFPEVAFRVDGLVAASKGYVGREIEKAVREARFTAFADGNREMMQADVEAALREVIPVSTSHAEVIERLRRWKKDGLASPASSEEAAAVVGGGRVIETY